MKHKDQAQARDDRFRLLSLARRGKSTKRLASENGRKRLSIANDFCCLRERRRIRRRRERLVTRSMWYSFDSPRRGGHGDVVNRFASDDLGFCASVARFSHSSLGALRILAHFSATRRASRRARSARRDRRPVVMVFIRLAATRRLQIYGFRRPFVHFHFCLGFAPSRTNRRQTSALRRTVSSRAQWCRR